MSEESGSKDIDVEIFTAPFALDPIRRVDASGVCGNGEAGAISVVIPTYNGARYIREALESVAAQTHLPDEIIVVDDCSTDDTLAIVEHFAKSSSFSVHAERLPSNSGGPAGPLNAAVAKARGQYIAVLEQDDRMTTDRLERQIAAVNAYSTARFSSGRARNLSTGRFDGFFWQDADQFADVADADTLAAKPPLLHVPGAVAFRALLKRQFMLTNSSFFFHRTLWEECGGFDRRASTASDLSFALGAAARTDFALVNAPIVEFRFHDESLDKQSPTISALNGGIVRLRRAREFPQYAADDVAGVYWKLRLFVLRELWSKRMYWRCAKLITELMRCRLGPHWRS